MPAADNNNAYFVWDGSLDTGIEAIDAQHRQIAVYLNRLHSAVRAQNTTDTRLILDELIAHMQNHFAYEEKLQHEIGYDKFESHYRVHRTFVERLQDNRDRYSSNADVARKMLSDLHIWLTDHIRREDGDFAAAVRKHMRESKGWLSKTLGRFFGGATH